MIEQIKTTFKRYGSNLSTNAGDTIKNVSTMVGITMINYDVDRDEFSFVVNRAYPIFKTKSLDCTIKLMDNLKKGELPFYGYGNKEKITFGGRHKDKFIAQVPTSYLNWMKEKNIQLSLVNKELDRRNRGLSNVNLEKEYNIYL